MRNFALRVLGGAAEAGSVAALTAILLLPFAFGGGPVWAWGTAAAVLGAAVVLRAGADLAGATDGSPVPHPIGPVLAVGLGLAAWSGLQALPGMPGAHPIWADAATALQRGDVSATWSLTPAAARPGLAWLLAVLAAVWLGARASATVRTRALPLIAATAALAGAYGLAVLWVGSEQVLWLEKQDYRDAATGPFVNRNAFAAYLGLGLLALAAALQAARRRGGGVRSWMALAAVLLPVALLATQSRAGLAAFAAAALVLALRHRPALGWRGLALVGGVSVAALGVLAGRWAELPGAIARRGEIYGVVADAMAARPWLGHGLGSFEAVFRLYRPEEFERVVTQAHNLYLHAAVIWGVPVALLLVALGLWLLRLAWARAGPGGTVALGTVVLIGAHGLVDFAPQVPGVALLAAWLVGAGLSSPTPRSGPSGAAGSAPPAPRLSR
jgi:O-antigen ligase